jgi:uncharacterized protein (DUF2267 family)
MAATGLDAFDKTLQTTNIWLDELMEQLGPNRRLAWHVLGAVLHALRDRVPVELAAHLGAQLPLLVRGHYYDQWHPASQPQRLRTLDEFMARVAMELQDTRSVDVEDATRAVFRTLAHHVDPGQVTKIVDALPEPVREFWLASAAVRSRNAATSKDGEAKPQA